MAESFSFSSAAISSVILAIAAIIMGRLLGPNLYGQYNLILTVPTLILLFTDLGLSTALTKFIASLRVQGKTGRIHAIVRRGFTFRLLIGLACSVISVVFASYFALIVNRPDLSFYVAIACASLFFQVVHTTVYAVFVGLDKSEYSALLLTVRAILTTVLQVALVLLSFSLTGAIVGFVGGFVIRLYSCKRVAFH